MIQKLNNKLFFLNFLLMFSFSNIMSLALSRYKIRALDINIVDKKMETKNPNICCEYKIFNKADCKKYLGRGHFIEEGYQPIQIKLTNNSDKPFMFSLNSFNLSCIHFYTVAENVEFDITFPRNTLFWAFLSVTAGILSFPICYAIALSFPMLLTPILITTASVFCGWMIYSELNPTINKKLYDRFSKKSLSDQIVEPFSTINGLIFVSKKDLNSGISFVTNS